MSVHRAGYFCVVAVLAATTLPTLASDPDSLKQAATLVGQAIQAEIDGDLVGRDRMLKEASQLETTFAPSRWLQGQLRTQDGNWTSIEESVADGQMNKLLADYEAMRAKQPATVQGNWQASLWCAKNGMRAQCRAHLENILMLDHDNATARAALGHQLVGHEWLSPADQADLIRRAEFVRQGNEKYGDQIKGLIVKIHSAKNNERQQALKELSAIDDPLAIPVIESAAEFGSSVALLSAKLLASFDHPESAKSLMRIAVFHSDLQVTEAAIEALKSKRFYDFVPEMLAAMSSQVFAMTVPVFSATGQLAGFRQSFSKEGDRDYRTFNFDTQLNTKTVQLPVATSDSQVTYLGSSTLIAYQPYHPGHDLKTYLNQTTTVSYAKSDPAAVQASIDEAFFMQQMVKLAAVASVMDRQARVARENQQIALLNSRIAFVLSAVAEVEFPRVPRDVWNWWDNYNETSYQRSKYTREQYGRATYTAPEVNFYQNQYANPVASHKGFTVSTRCCFVAGTKINTLRGLLPIESVLPGDMALSCDIHTRELTYKPVICGTNRDAAKTVILKVDDDTVQATTGHLLWVSGKGWVKAGDIKAGDLLHTVAEPAVVISAVPGPELPTHNLIVADNHNYFVGTSRILSHDVLPRVSVIERVPGQSLFTTK